MSIYRILACTALALIILSRRHVTIWVGDWAVATLPVLGVMLITFAVFAVSMGIVLWRMRRPLAWRTT